MEWLAPSYFFRTPSRMGTVDKAALALARGRVLDVGAGVGAHALPLQRRGHAVTALELIPEAVRILEGRGLADVHPESVWRFRPGSRYDTVLALMNGTALAGTFSRLEPLLVRLGELVNPDGRLLVDSTEVGERRAPGDPSGEEGEETDALELHYQLEYEGERGPPFPQLFVGPRTLARAGRAAGWRSEVVARRGARFLALMTPVGRRRSV